MHVGRGALVTALVLSVVACGSQEPSSEPTAAEAPAATSGQESSEPAQGGGMAVEGTLGTIPERRIEETMQQKLPAFQRCFVDGMSEVEFLGGYIKFYF